MGIAWEKFEAILKEHKLDKVGVDMSAFRKYELGGRRIYVAKTKTVSRVDFTNLKFQHPAVNILSDDYIRENRMGLVDAQLDFSKKEEQVLEAFSTACAMLQAMAGDEKAMKELTPKHRKEAEQQMEAGLPPRRRRQSQQETARG